MRVEPVFEHSHDVHCVNTQLEGACDLKVGVCDVLKKGCRGKVLRVGLGRDIGADLGDRCCGGVDRPAGLPLGSSSFVSGVR